MKLLSALFCLFSLATAYDWDKDTIGNCEDYLDTCQSDPSTYYQCPIACAEHLGNDRLVRGKSPLPGGFDRQFWNNEHHEMVRFDRFRGSVTLVAVLPLLPGMAQFYVDLLHQVKKDNPTIECVVLPFTQDPDVSIQMPPNSPCLLLETFTHESLAQCPIVKYFEVAERRQAIPVANDRAIFYLKDHTDTYNEKRITPTHERLDRLVASYARQSTEAK